MAHAGGIIDRDHFIHTIITNIPYPVILADVLLRRLTRDNEYARRSFPAYERFGQDKEQKQHRVCQAKKA